MNFRLRRGFSPRRRIFRGGLAITTVVALLVSPLSGQTTATGALAGELLDPTGAVIPGATLRLINSSTSRTLTAISSGSGRFSFLLLPPGSYELQASKPDFETVELFGLEVSVTETLEASIPSATYPDF
jgi:hypothetical protein